MRKIVLITALLLFAFSNIQEANAQTKEETIEWLKEYLRSGNKIVPKQIYKNEFGFYLSYLDECGFEIKSSSMHIIVVPLNGMKIDSNGELKFSNDAIKMINLNTHQESYISESMFFRIVSINGSYDEIRNKFNHLSSFCDK